MPQWHKAWARGLIARGSVEDRGGCRTMPPRRARQRCGRGGADRPLVEMRAGYGAGRRRRVGGGRGRAAGPETIRGPRSGPWKPARTAKVLCGAPAGGEQRPAALLEVQYLYGLRVRVARQPRLAELALRAMLSRSASAAAGKDPARRPAARPRRRALGSARRRTQSGRGVDRAHPHGRS